MTPLGGSHPHRGVTLNQLNIAIAKARAIDDVFYLQVFVKIDKLAPLWVLENGPGVVDMTFTLNRFIVIGFQG